MRSTAHHHIHLPVEFTILKYKKLVGGDIYEQVIGGWVGRYPAHTFHIDEQLTNAIFERAVEFFDHGSADDAIFFDAIAALKLLHCFYHYTVKDLQAVGGFKIAQALQPFADGANGYRTVAGLIRFLGKVNRLPGAFFFQFVIAQQLLAQQVVLYVYRIIFVDVLSFIADQRVEYTGQVEFFAGNIPAQVAGIDLVVALVGFGCIAEKAARKQQLQFCAIFLQRLITSAIGFHGIEQMMQLRVVNGTVFGIADILVLHLQKAIGILRKSAAVEPGHLVVAAIIKITNLQGEAVGQFFGLHIIFHTGTVKKKFGVGVGHIDGCIARHDHCVFLRVSILTGCGQ